MSENTREQRIERLFDSFLSVLEDIIDRGEPLTDENGNAVTDDRGFAVFKTPSASHMKRASELFDKLNIGAVKGTDSAIGRKLEEAQARGWKIGNRPVDEGRLPKDDVEAV